MHRLAKIIWELEPYQAMFFYTIFRIIAIQFSVLPHRTPIRKAQLYRLTFPMMKSY